METKRLRRPSACGKEPGMISVQKRCPNQTIEAAASACATLRPNGTGSRATPWFEGAHSVRRCSLDSKSEHLGKSRRFLRRCAPLSKVRTENCASSKFLTPRSFSLVSPDGRIRSCGGFPVRRICSRSRPSVAKWWYSVPLYAVNPFEEVIVSIEFVSLKLW